LTGAGLRLKDQETPSGFTIAVLLQPDTVVKMRKLAMLLSADIVSETEHDGYTEIIIRKR